MLFRNDVKRRETIHGWRTVSSCKNLSVGTFRFCIHRGRNTNLIMVCTLTRIIFILDQKLFQHPQNLFVWTMKKRRATLATPMKQPDLATFKQLVVDSQKSKVKDPKKLPIIEFVDSWGEKLESGWLRRLVSSGLIPGKNLTGYEIKIVGHLAAIISTSGEPKWASKLSYAFNCDVKTIRFAVQRHLEDLLKPSTAITNGPHSAPLLMQTPTSHLQAKKRSRICEESNEKEIEVVLKNVDDASSTSLNNSSSEASPTEQEPDIRPRLLFETTDAKYQTPPPKKQQHDSSGTDDVPHTQTRWQRIIASVRKSAKQNAGNITSVSRSFAQSAKKTARRITRAKKNGTPDDVMAAIGAITEHLKKSNVLDQHVMALVVEACDLAKRSKQSKIIEFKAKKNRTAVSKLYVELVPRRTGGTTETNPVTNDKKARLGANVLLEILQKMCGEKDVQAQKDVLEKLVHQDFDGNVQFEKFLLDTADCIAVRELAGGVSTNALLRILSAISKLLNTNKLVPTQLKKKISRREWQLLKVKFTQLQLETSKGESGECVFYWIENGHLLMEQLVASTILEGKKQASIDFSNFDETHIFSRGIDKAVDLCDMIRYVNRKDGNTGEHCIPIGVVEGASETASNLLKTVLSKARNHLQSKVQDGKMHLFDIRFCSNSETDIVLNQDGAREEGGNQEKENKEEEEIMTEAIPNAAVCMLVEFVLPEGKQLNNPLKITVFEENIVHTNQSVAQFYLESTDAGGEERQKSDKIVVTDEMLQPRSNGTYTFDASLRMVQLLGSNTLEDGREESEVSYIGCELFCSGQKMYSFKFNLPVDGFPKDNEPEVKARCQRVISIPAQDGKMATMVFGLGTCGVTYPCLRCTRHHAQRSFPEWMDEKHSDIVGASQFECKDFPLREGTNSYEECYKKFKNAMGEKIAYTALESKLPPGVVDRTLSVTSGPLMMLDLDLHSGEPMHVHMGLVSHATEEATKMLASVGGDKTGWAEKLKQVMVEKARVIRDLEKSQPYLAARRTFNFWKKQYELSLKALEEAREAGEDPDHIKYLEEILEEAAEDMKTSSDSTKYGEMNRKIRGAKEFTTVLAAAKKATKLERLDQAEYLFLQAIRTKAGKFNKQHGSMELTAARGMLALEHRKAIYDVACQAYELTDQKRNLEVRAILDWWLEIAGYLFRMGELMKSQKKMTKTRLEELELLVVNFAVCWRKEITYKNPVFWKLHIMECCLMNFIRVTGMSGRMSAEGMENKHFHMAVWKRLMAPIVKTEIRVAKLSQRQQIHLLPGLWKKFETIENRTVRTGKRGTYTNKGLSTRNKEDIVVDLVADDDADVPDGYFELENSGILPNEFAELYNFYKRRLMPKEWCQPFESSEELGSKAKREARHHTI
jgi:tetratricopeptide (TPR) repeat protein